MNTADKIKQKLENSLSPSYLKLTDDSEKHRGHIGHTGENGSHFSLTIVSAKFENVTMVKQHKMIYEILAEEMKIIHALALKTIKPSQTK